MALAAKVAVNPLPWVLGPNGFDMSPTNVRAAVAGIADAGFTAMHADVPAEWTPAEYREVLADHGVRPAPGYFGAHFDGPAKDLPELVEQAKRHAFELRIEPARALAPAATDSRLAAGIAQRRRRQGPAMGVVAEFGRVE